MTNENNDKIDDFSMGFIVGILIGEGHFGGDGKQPQITLRMHARHEVLFKWLLNLFPGSKLYGPYHHGGRHYYQWMARGEVLRKNIAPMIAKTSLQYIDPYAYARFEEMVRKYGIPV